MFICVHLWLVGFGLSPQPARELPQWETVHLDLTPEMQAVPADTSAGEPCRPALTRSQIAGERIRELRKGVTLGGIFLKELIEEGRE